MVKFNFEEWPKKVVMGEKCFLVPNLEIAEAAKKLLCKNRISSHIMLDREEYRQAKF